MIVPTEMAIDQLRTTLQRFSAIVGWSLWEKRFHEFENWRIQNPLFDDFISSRYQLELAHKAVRSHLRIFNNYPWPIRSAEEYRFLSFAAVVVRIYERLSEKGRNRLANMIRGGLNDEYGISSLAFEIRIAAHLMRAGFDVNFHDLEEGGFDFLITKNDIEIEVECKQVSADIGRKIHNRALYSLGGYLYEDMRLSIESREGGQYVHIEIPGRLEKSEQYLSAVGAAFKESVHGKKDAESEFCRVVWRPFSLRGGPFDTSFDFSSRNKLGQIIRDQFGQSIDHSLFIARKGRVMIVSVKSKQPDSVVTTIFQRLREESGRQFTRSRPGMLFVNLADVSSEQLIEIAAAESRGTDIQKAISVLLRKRKYVHTISLMTDGNVQHNQVHSWRGTQQSIQESGPTYTFHNPDHPLYQNEILRSVFI